MGEIGGWRSSGTTFGLLNYKKAAGEVLTAKQAPHRPGIAPALGLRAGSHVVNILSQTGTTREMQSVRTSLAEGAVNPDNEINL